MYVYIYIYIYILYLNRYDTTRCQINIFLKRFPRTIHCQSVASTCTDISWKFHQLIFEKLIEIWKNATFEQKRFSPFGTIQYSKWSAENSRCFKGCAGFFETNLELRHLSGKFENGKNDMLKKKKIEMLPDRSGRC